MRKIRYGMVGGGEGAFIGAIHRIAAALDSEIELVAGAFSSDPDRARRSAAALGLPEERAYATLEDMIIGEQRLPEGERMEFLAIVTPNHLHFKATKAALEAGFHVLCDKPAAFSLAEVLDLEEIVRETGKLYGLTYTYSGYPMVEEARARVAAGELGRVRKIIVEYPQGWLSEPQDSKQAAWRTDPARAGKSCCIGDIGTHAFHLAEHISGQRVTELCADLSTFVDGRQLDDDGAALLRFSGGAKGSLMASQVCVGEENGLNIRIYGDRAALEWHQLEPNTLILKSQTAPEQRLRTGWAGCGTSTFDRTRTPAGHPEGYLEAFANLYQAFADCIRDGAAGPGAKGEATWFPSTEDGVRGMAFVEAMIASSEGSEKWLDFEAFIEAARSA